VKNTDRHLDAAGNLTKGTIMNTELLFNLLSTKRPYGTESETMDLVHLYIVNDNVTRDIVMRQQSEVMCIVYDTCPEPKTMFTCHLDTVHRDTGHVNLITTDVGRVMTDATTVLGADDGAGVALLVHMINEGVKGRFMFFVGEEKGGIGSSYTVANRADLFEGISHAIAFDRRGVSDVITSQSGGKCCSLEFSSALCNELSFCTDYDFAPTSGVYTDTAEMIYLVPECTNVSVGYYNEHTVNESLDLVYLQQLSDAVTKVRWDELPVVRQLPLMTVGYEYGDYELDDRYLVNDIIDMMEENKITVSDLLIVIKKHKLTQLL
jgi:hypothetical protein